MEQLLEHTKQPYNLNVDIHGHHPIIIMIYRKHRKPLLRHIENIEKHRKHRQHRKPHIENIEKHRKHRKPLHGKHRKTLHRKHRKLLHRKHRKHRKT